MEDADERRGSSNPTDRSRTPATSIYEVPQGLEALTQVAEYTSDLIGLCDAAGRLQYLNPAGRRLIGVEDADIFPAQLTDYVVAHQRRRIDAEVIPAARAAGVWEGEMQLVNIATSQVVDVERATYARRGDAGEVSGFVSIMRDVTARKAADDLLRRQIDTFHALIRNNPFGVYLVDADFKLTVISRGAEQVFAGVMPAIGRDFAEVIRVIWPEPFASAVIGHFRHTLATGDPYQETNAVEQRADADKEEAYDWRIERVMLPDQRFGVVCYFYDFTEREQLTRDLAEREQELGELSRDLERRVRDRTTALNQANERLSAEIERREAMEAAHLQSQKLEAIGQLTSGIAHDFNNILGAVIGGFTVIEGRTEDARVRQVVEMGKAAAERGAAMVRQLLAFARLEDVAPQAIDLPRAIDEIKDLIAHGLRGRTEVVIDCPADIAPALADPAALQSALLNLATNASDAMAGAGALTIRVAERPATGFDHPVELAGRDAVVIDVTDDGPGMDGPTLQRITEPFFTTKPRGLGTGLGLAMVQRFVDQSLGALRIESQVGRGSKFSIYLPQATRSNGVLSDRRSDDQHDTSRAFETILLVDDDADLRGILAAGLADGGFEAITADGAEAALQVLRTHAVDALVTDLDMPGRSGAELIATIRATGSSLPCLVMTAVPDLPPGFAEPVLRKPFGPAVLSNTLRQMLVARDQRDSDAERIERLALRLKSDCTRSLLNHWRAIRRDLGPPDFRDFDLSACSEPHRIVIAQVDLGKVPISFAFHLVGDTLRQALPSLVAAADFPVSGNDSVAAREAAYRRCALTGRPSYEYARFDLGDTFVETFERLLLPFSTAGDVIDRIVGAVVIERETVGER